MTKLLTKNSKIAKSGDGTQVVYNFGLPAYRSRNGDVTCPAAGECGQAAGCYALQGAYTWTNVAKAYEWRYQQSLRADFGDQVAAELRPKIATAKRKGQQLYIRIHDSGDYYNLNYAKQWLQLAKRFPDVKFYSYTKMVVLFHTLAKRGDLPDNFTIIYSEGGTQDQFIRPGDRHSRVFATLQDLTDAGYADATKNDLVALGDNPKVGLVYHGAKGKAWTTDEATV